MKKTILVILSMLLAFVLVGCSSEQSANQDSSAQPSQETAENSTDATQESYDYEFNKDEANHEAYENTTLGEQVHPKTVIDEATGQEVPATIPEELYGTWNVNQGLPEGLSSYSLTINPDGSVSQTTVDSSGNTVETPSTIYATEDDGYTIVDSGGSTLLNLDYENGQLTTEGLANQETVLNK